MAAALGLLLLLLFPAPPGAGQEPQLEKAPKLVPVKKLPRLLEKKIPAGDLEGHGMGFIPISMDMSHLTGQRMPVEQVPPPDASESDVSPPDVSQTLSSFDWRDEDKVTEVKNQGNCGSCYAFAALACIESKMLIDGHAALPEPDYSENHAKECNYRETSCSGGNSYDVANLLSQKGTVMESCDPYIPSDVACNASCPYQETVLSWRQICGNVVPDTDVLKAYIHTCGPVYTTLYAGFPGFDNSYNGTYTFYYDGPEFPNHAVLIVGWDDGLPHDGGTGGWIAKNSWGADWGDEGYFTIAYGSASIGMYSAFLYEWQDYDEHGDLYYYDDAGRTDAWGEWGGLNTTAWGLCKFYPVDDAPIERVEFWTTDITTDVDIYIYDDFDGAKLSNRLARKRNCSFSEAGYHSVVLDTPVPVSAGDDVIAVVKFTNSSFGFPVAADNIGPCETGRTYISIEGSNGPWIDLGANYGVDVCIRLRTYTMPVSITTDDADNVTTDSATLNGNLSSLGDYSSANISFEWGTESGVYTVDTTAKTMTEPGAFSANLSNLAPSTTYYFRAKATSNPTFYGNELSFTTLKVLSSMEIAPDSPTIALGRTQQFTATGIYSDNSTEDLTTAVTWTSDNASVATIDEHTGLAQSLAEGQTTITAASGNVSDTATLTVGSKMLDSIDIAPDSPTIALGRTQQLTATGTYSDKSTDDLTTAVTWTSDNTEVATIGENTGLVRSLSEGQTTISAASGNVSDTATLTVAPEVLDALEIAPDSPTIALGRTQQLTATGTYSGNTTLDITDNVSWSSSNTTVAMINAAGLATSYAEGTTVITATLEEISDNTTLIVGPKVLDSIEIAPDSPTIAIGRTRQFNAIGTYSDNTTLDITDNVIWNSSNITVAMINAAGLATSYAEGTTVITAASGNVSDTTILTVSTKVLDLITVTPSSPSIAAGLTQQFAATGTYSDNNTLDITGNVTWSSSNTTVAMVDTAGLATSYAEGSTVITATLGEISDNTTLIVGPKVLDALEVMPDNSTIALGRTQQFTTIGTYSDNTTLDITDNVSWSSSNTTVAMIDAAGLATSYAEGTTIITASKDEITSNEAVLTITLPEAPSDPGSSSNTGGGGGGGGGGAGLTSLNEYITMECRITGDVTAVSSDKKVILFIPKDTIARNRVGSLLYHILITEKEKPPAPLLEYKVIGLVYDIGPNGANFDPPITLTFEYDASAITQGVSEKELVVFHWDSSAKKWIDLESIIDPDAHTISAKISRISVYTVMAPEHPASFNVTSLSVTPGEVNLGESVTISVLVTNPGERTRRYEVSLKMDDVVTQTKEVILAGGDSETVSFSVTADTVGEHAVNVNGLMETFKVGELEVAPAPTPTPLPSAAPSPASFVLSDLSVTPNEAGPTEQVTISVVVTNTGGSEGSYTIVLKINGTDEAEKEVTVGTGNSESVSFTTAKEIEGIYTVDINGEVGQFTIIVPQPLTPEPVGALPVQPSANWWLIGGIVAGCVVVAAALLVYCLFWRKRGAQQPF